MHMTDTPAINDPRFLPDVDPMFEYYLVDKPKLTYESPEDGPLTRAFVRVLEGFLGRHEMEGHYQTLKAQDVDSKMFFREAFKLTNITLDGDTSPLADIPRSPGSVHSEPPFRCYRWPDHVQYGLGLRERFSGRHQLIALSGPRFGPAFPTHRFFRN